MRPELVKTWLQDLQSKIVAALEAVDGQPFCPRRLDPPHWRWRAVLRDRKRWRVRAWRREFLARHRPGAAALGHRRPSWPGRAFEAMGVSLVLHPRNPYAPTAHMNVRYFVATAEGQGSRCGGFGGMDLTRITARWTTPCIFTAPANRRCSRLANTTTRNTKPGATAILPQAPRRTALRADFSLTT